MNTYLAEMLVRERENERAARRSARNAVPTQRVDHRVALCADRLSMELTLRRAYRA